MIEWFKDKMSKRTIKRGMDLAVNELVNTDTTKEQIEFLLSTPQMKAEISELSELIERNANKDEFMKLYEKMGPRRSSLAIAVLNIHLLGLDKENKS